MSMSDDLSERLVPEAELELPAWDLSLKPRESIDIRIREYIKKLVADTYIEGSLLKEIYAGAHVIVPGEELYHGWKNEGGIHRYSSHASIDPQYALRSGFHKELLFGTTYKKTNDGSMQKATWFQLEKTPSTGGKFFDHIMDYINYKWTGMNQGPYGTSVHTDKNPIVAHTLHGERMD